MDYISNYKANDINIYTKTTNAEFKWPVEVILRLGLSRDLGMCMDGKLTFYHFTKNIKLECDGSYRIKPQANGCPGPPRSLD